MSVVRNGKIIASLIRNSIVSKSMNQAAGTHLADVSKQAFHPAAHQVVRTEVATEQFPSKCLIFGKLLIFIAFAFLYLAHIIGLPLYHILILHSLPKTMSPYKVGIRD